MTDPKEFQIVRGVVHDIKQMLMVITGRAGLLLEHDPDPELRQHLLAMELAASDVGAMLGRLPGMGAGIPGENIADVLLVVQESCRLIQPPDRKGWAGPDQAVESGSWSVELRIQDDLLAGLPAQILREVINNLLTNALEAMPSGGRIVFSGSTQGDRVHLQVQDSGPGIPPDRTTAIFESGFTTSGKGDRGVGLTGCRDLLKQFDGALTLAPDTGEGAVFIIDLPLATQVRSRPETGAMEPGEVLVVDDEPAVRDMLADVLTELGWQPSVAVDAAQALEQFSTGRFPVALVDQSLPGVSGLELALELREMDPRIVLVLVTGWGNEDIMSRASASGIDITAEKPLGVGKIRSILGQASVLYRKHDEEREES